MDVYYCSLLCLCIPIHRLSSECFIRIRIHLIRLTLAEYDKISREYDKFGHYFIYLEASTCFLNRLLFVDGIIKQFGVFSPRYSEKRVLQYFRILYHHPAMSPKAYTCIRVMSSLHRVVSCTNIRENSSYCKRIAPLRVQSEYLIPLQ